MKLFQLLLTLNVLILVVTAVEYRHRGLESNFEVCGRIQFRNRIIGGKTASLGQFPWMARLGYQRGDKLKFDCGGSLLNNRYVITAGHCIFGAEDKLHIVRLGENYVDVPHDCDNTVCAPDVQDILIEQIYLHPQYYHRDAANDIGIIRMSRNAIYNDFVAPICLPQGGILKKNYVTEAVQVAGWGVINSATEETSKALQYVTLPVRDNCACFKYLPNVNITDHQLCVGVEEGLDSCTGDSGGPLMKIESVNGGSKKYHLLGVVSVGRGYCGEGPALYTNVVKYMDWIQETLNEYSPNEPSYEPPKETVNLGYPQY